MKAHVIYDSAGKIWNIIRGEETTPQNPKCLEVDIPDGAGLAGIDLTDPDNPQPMIVWPVSEAELDEAEHQELVEGIRARVTAGENLKDIIGALDLTDEEKWQLEKEVKEGL